MARATLLSPARYQRMGFGQALPNDYTLSQLRTALIRAQSQVSRYCNVPKQPQAFDWRGGTMTDERHQWKLQNPLAYNSGVKRVYLNVSPIKAVTAFSIDLGKTYHIDFDPNTNIYINSIESYVELIAVSPVVVGFWPLAAALGLYNPVSRTTYTYGWQFTVAGDVLEAESPTVYSMAYGNLSQSPPVVVYLDGVAQVSGYAVNFDDGTVTFDTRPAPGVEVSADYVYLVPDEIVQAIGITTTWQLGQARMAQRGMIGLSSIKVAEVTLSSMVPVVNRNGATIPAEAASLLDGYAMASAA